mgnify:CR=1 FL=1
MKKNTIPVIVGLIGTMLIILYALYTHYSYQDTKPLPQTLHTTSSQQSEEPQPEPEKIPLVTVETLPADIHPDQVIKIIHNQYALVVKPSLNIPLPNIPPTMSASYRGVLQWNEATRMWEKILLVEDTNPEISVSNNPLDMWFEGPSDTDREPHLLVVDVNGAGSGEGVAKVLVPTSLSWSEWNVVECFDYAFDLGRGEQRDSATDECNAVRVILPDMQSNEAQTAS